LGRKVHPVGVRIGIIKDWQARWYAEDQYREFLQEDLKLRQVIRSKYADAAISGVEIERQANEISITVHTARPGVVIGRGGQRVDEMRADLEKLVGKKVRLNVQEIRQPELDSYLVARSIAEQLERRVAYRRAMKQSIARSIQAGARGVRVCCAGRLGGAEIARRQMMHQGQVPLQTLRADIDYGFTEAKTTMGRLGIKVWIYKGDILPEPRVVVAEEEEPEVAEDTVEPVVAQVASKPARSAEPVVVEESTGVAEEKE
jgi:small subunit ribosomal protein S3